MNHSSPPVSEAQIKAFHTRGHICMRDFLPREAVDGLREISDTMSSRAASILRHCRTAGVALSDYAKEQPLELIVVPEENCVDRVCRYEFMLKHDSRFETFVSDYVEPIVAELVGGPIVAFKDKTNEKMPGGGAFRPHQDFAAYQAFKPRYYATALLTIDPSNSNNGCVQFATNLSELVQARRDFVLDVIEQRALLHYYDGGACNGDIRADISAELDWEPVETNPPDLVIFDSFVPHYSRANESTGPRRAVFVTFNRASEGICYEDYYAEKRRNYDDPKFHISTPTRHRTKTEAFRPA